MKIFLHHELASSLKAYFHVCTFFWCLHLFSWSFSPSSPSGEDHVFAEREEGQLSEEELSRSAFSLSINRKKFVTLLERAVEVTEGCCVEQLQTLHSTFQQLVFHHRMSWDRGPLLQVNNRVPIAVMTSILPHSCCW